MAVLRAGTIVPWHCPGLVPPGQHPARRLPVAGQGFGFKPWHEHMASLPRWGRGVAEEQLAADSCQSADSWQPCSRARRPQSRGLFPAISKSFIEDQAVSAAAPNGLAANVELLANIEQTPESRVDLFVNDCTEEAGKRHGLTGFGRSPAAVLPAAMTRQGFSLGGELADGAKVGLPGLPFIELGEGRKAVAQAAD